MRLLLWCRVGLIVLSCATLARGYAATPAYDESTASDLSNDGLSPTFIAVALGSNQVLGTTGFIGTGIDRDYFRITVPAGLRLAHIDLLPGTSVNVDFSFLGVEAGTQVTLGTDPQSAAGLLGWIHYTRGQVGLDLLPKMGIPNAGSSGFVPPLGAGDYAFWVQDVDGGTARYGFDLVLTAPEPDVCAFMLAALGIAIAAARRRAK